MLTSMSLLCKARLAVGGLVDAEYAEAFTELPLPDWLNGWEVVRSGQAGAVHYALLTAAVVP